MATKKEEVLLTERQYEVYKFILEHVDKTKQIPSMTILKKHFRCSYQTIRNLLLVLNAKGVINYPFKNITLTMKDIEVCKVIKRFEALGISPSYVEIAKKLRISLSSVQKRIYRLLAFGYVEKEYNNRRCLKLTEAGIEEVTKYV